MCCFKRYAKITGVRGSLETWNTQLEIKNKAVWEIHKS